MTTFNLLALVLAAVSLAIALRNRRRAKQLRRLLHERDQAWQSRVAELRDEFERRLANYEAELKASPAPTREEHALHEKRLNHLQGELTNLAVVPNWHPVRQALAEKLRPRLQCISDQLVPVLFDNQLPFDELDWMYKLPDRRFPYSLTFEEGMLLYHLVAANGLRSGYEIATAFGFSSFFLALASEQTGGHLTSADAYIEEEMEDFIYDLASAEAHVESLRRLQNEGALDQLPRGLQFAIEGIERLGLESIVDYRIACSPQGVPELLEGSTLDFAFIDGGHFGEQPVLDVESVLPYLDSDRFLVVFHDTQCEAVAKGVHYAAGATGTRPERLHTRNCLTILSRGLDEEVLRECREMTLRQFA